MDSCAHRHRKKTNTNSSSSANPDGEKSKTPISKCHTKVAGLTRFGTAGRKNAAPFGLNEALLPGSQNRGAASQACSMFPADKQNGSPEHARRTTPRSRDGEIMLRRRRHSAVRVLKSADAHGCYNIHASARTLGIILQSISWHAQCS